MSHIIEEPEYQALRLAEDLVELAGKLIYAARKTGMSEELRAAADFIAAVPELIARVDAAEAELTTLRAEVERLTRENAELRAADRDHLAAYQGCTARREAAQAREANMREALREALDLAPRMNDDDPIAPAMADWCGRVRGSLSQEPTS